MIMIIVAESESSRTLMFQPSGPNFLRSRVIAWKKQIPNTIRLQSLPITIEKWERYKITVRLNFQ